MRFVFFSGRCCAFLIFFDWDRNRLWSVGKHWTHTRLSDLEVDFLFCCCSNRFSRSHNVSKVVDIPHSSIENDNFSFSFNAALRSTSQMTTIMAVIPVSVSSNLNYPFLFIYFKLFVVSKLRSIQIDRPA